MANAEHVALILRGQVDVWNAWRTKQRDVTPDLRGQVMSEQLTGVVEGQTRDGAIRSRQQTRTVRFAKLWLAGLAATLLLGVQGALAICPCGDGICGGATCIPPETSQTCPADCGDPPLCSVIRTTRGDIDSSLAGIILPHEH